MPIHYESVIAELRMKLRCPQEGEDWGDSSLDLYAFGATTQPCP